MNLKSKSFLFGLLLASLCSCSEFRKALVGGLNTEELKNPTLSTDVKEPIYKSDEVKSSEQNRTSESRASLIERGNYLVNSVAACGACHGGKTYRPGDMLTGGRTIYESSGSYVAPNISSDPVAGIGSWKVTDIVKALRSSVKPSGSELAGTGHMGYQWMSNKDATAVALYLKDSKLNPGGGEAKSDKSDDTTFFNFEIYPEQILDVGFVPSIPEAPTASYGRYLANNVAKCQTCHFGKEGYFSGKVPFAGYDTDGSEQDTDGFPYNGPDIRASSDTGIKKWTSENIIQYLTSGTTANGKVISFARCPWDYYSDMTDNDKEAIAKYLRSL